MSAVVPLLLLLPACHRPMAELSPSKLPRWNEPPPPADSIQMIRLDHYGDGWGGTATYAFELWRNGDATYDGFGNVPLLGRYTAHVDSATFSRLATELIKVGLFTFAPLDWLDAQEGGVLVGCNDMEDVEVAIILASRRKYAVRDQCNGHDLDRITSVIDSAAGRLSWQPARSSSWLPPNQRMDQPGRGRRLSWGWHQQAADGTVP